MAIELEETTDPPGLEVYDSIEQRHVHVRTSGAVSPRPADVEDFCFPVDVACSIETEQLVFGQRYFVSIHAADGRWERSLETCDETRLTPGTKFVGFSGPIQLYCQFTTGGSIETGMNSTRVIFDEETTVTVGARSIHDRPVGTIRTPPDPESMMQAVSAFSSALKTTSPERTWPSLRGHPPLVELGDDLEIPADVSPRDTDVTITVPPSRRHVCTVAPLSFSLGATIRPGTEPILETPQFEYRLGADDRFEDDVATLLKQTFFLDCLARTEGIYRYGLYERARLVDDLPFDLADVYDLPLPDRLERYLEVPYDRIEPYVPRWPLTAHVPADPGGIKLLPFVVNELGIVREPRGSVSQDIPEPKSREASLARSTVVERDSSDEPPENHQFVVPEVNDESIEHAWFGDHVPLTASKATLESYHSQLSRDDRSESIDILLVCNDVRMLSEHDLLGDVYGNRGELPFDVTSEFGVNTEQLATLLTEGGYDFLHYIGHATPDGLECSDGKLDVRTLEDVDLGVFFLNACRSYGQGLALVRRGAFAGVSTLRDVDNQHAVETGETIARLLNLGFPLRATLEIVRENSTVKDDYLIVGDGSADIAQTEGGAPVLVELERRSEDEFDFAIRSYSTKGFKLGTTTASNHPTVTDRHLSPKCTPFSRISEQSLREYLTWTSPPVLLDGQLHWTDGIGWSLFE